MSLKEWLVVFVVLAQALDAWSTHYALKRGFVEKNPLMAWLFENNPLGSKAIWAVKIPLVVGLVAFYDLLPTWAVAAVAVLYLAVLVNNGRHLLQRRRREAGHV